MSRRRTNTGIPGLSFSWKRATGITTAKRRFARATGIPTTRSGRQRKIGGLATGSGCGCLIPILLVTAALIVTACNGARAPTAYPRAATTQISFTPGPLPTRTPRPVNPTAISLPTVRPTRTPRSTVAITRAPRPTAAHTTAAAVPAATRTVVAAPPTPSHAALFVRDVTIPDGTAFQPGKTFDKTWLFINTGTAAWGDDVRMRHIDGDTLCSEEEYRVPAAEPGANAEITLPMVAPDEPGTYKSHWQLCAGDACFGTAVYARIVSAWPATETPEIAAPPPIIVVPPQPPRTTATCDFSGNIYSCPNFPTHSAAQACFEYCWNAVGRDVHGLHADDDGSACESLP